MLHWVGYYLLACVACTGIYDLNWVHVERHFLLFQKALLAYLQRARQSRIYWFIVQTLGHIQKCTGNNAREGLGCATVGQDDAYFLFVKVMFCIS